MLMTTEGAVQFHTENYIQNVYSMALEFDYLGLFRVNWAIVDSGKCTGLGANIWCRKFGGGREDGGETSR